MTQSLSLGYSSCPNDIFIFEALVSGLLQQDQFSFTSVIEDVEALNLRALKGDLDITKISFHAWGHLRENYLLLDAGSALGRGCGPLLIARNPDRPQSLEKLTVAIPGELTTAALLLRLYAPELKNFKIMVFDQIFEAVKQGEVDAGLIIHESRFTYQREGLVSWVDLGDWWESETGCPIPLGGILAHRRLGDPVIQAFDQLLKQSITLAHQQTEAIWGSIKNHAQEIEDDVIKSHIDLYVTDFTESLGKEGRAALRVLLERGEKEGILPRFEGDRIFA